MPLYNSISTLNGVTSVVRCDYELFLNSPATPALPVTDILMTIDGIAIHSGVLADQDAVDAFITGLGFIKTGDWSYQIIDSKKNISAVVYLTHNTPPTIYYYVTASCVIIEEPLGQIAVTNIWNYVADHFLVEECDTPAKIAELAKYKLIERALTSPAVDDALTDEQKTLLANMAGATGGSGI